MDRLDLSSLPAWAVILIAIIAAVSPLILAWIGIAKAKQDKTAPVPTVSTQTEAAPSWIARDIFEIKMTGERTLNTTEALVKAISDLSIQVNTLVALLKRAEDKSHRR